MKKLLLLLLCLNFLGLNSFSQEKGSTKINTERKVKSNVGSNKTTKGGSKKKDFKMKKRKANN